jgi:hypothetical protein
MVSLPETTGGSIAPLLGLAASTPIQTPTTATGPLGGPYSSVLSTPSAMSGLGPFMAGGLDNPIGEPTLRPSSQEGRPYRSTSSQCRRTYPTTPHQPFSGNTSSHATSSLVNSGSSNQISTILVCVQCRLWLHQLCRRNRMDTHR